MTSCIVGEKIRAMGSGPLELFPFVVLAILMAMAGGISEHMLTSWSSVYCPPPFRRKVEGHCFWFSMARGAWFRVFSRYFVPLTPPTVSV